MLTYLIPTVLFLLGLHLETKYNRSLVLETETAQRTDNKNNLTLFLVLFTVAALRAPGTGADTGQYYAWFRRILATGVPVSSYWGTFVTSLKSGTFRDGLFWDLFSGLSALVIRNAQLWLAVVALIYLAAAYYVIRRYSKDAVISWEYLYCLYIFTFILQGLRQSVAMAVVLISFRYVHERKPAKFLLLIALAYLFHQSAVVFLLAYPLTKLKPKLYHLLAAMGVSVIVMLGPSAVLSWLDKLTGESRFAGYATQTTGLSWMAFLILLVIYAFCYYYRDRNDRLQNELLMLSLIGVCVQAVTAVISEMFRVSYYFNMFNMILLANTLDGIKTERIRLQYKIAVIVAFFLYNFVSGFYYYKFFF